MAYFPCPRSVPTLRSMESAQQRRAVVPAPGTPPRRQAVWSALLVILVCDISRRWAALPSEHQALCAQFAQDWEARAAEYGVDVSDFPPAVAIPAARLIVGAGSSLFANLPRARNANGTFMECPPEQFVVACDVLRTSWRRGLGPSTRLALEECLEAAAADDARAAIAWAARQPLILPPLQQCPRPGCGAWVWPCEAIRCCGNGRYVLPPEQFPRAPPPSFASMYEDEYFAANSRFFNMRVRRVHRL